ncbi:GA-like domain-containing protein [Psychrobacter raelei]|uniref:GA-like domain-containing protein n=1 Tax=Psychrobacter raelei TaxID=2565531 RepID=UPI003F63C847
MKNIIVKVNNATQTIAEHNIITQDGKPTVIRAVQNTNYELFDKAMGRAPNHIVTKRVGDDLHVSMEDDGESSDLIIEGFYDYPQSALIGLAEDGGYYYYIPDSGEVADYVTELESGNIEGQALGGEHQVTPWWVSAGDVEGFNAMPWLVGLAGIGIVGAALSNNGGSGGSSVPPVTEPDDVMIARDLIAKAEAAEAKAEGLLAAANEDGLITPKEKAAIVAANDEVIAAKEKAVAAVDSLPASEDKTALANRADAVEPVVVPAVNDANANGIDDAADEAAAVVDAAADLVAKAEAAEDAAQAELDKANEDGLITPEEKAAIVAANDEVIAAKEKAVAAVDSLPASEDKTALANRADAVEPVVVPAVNDANANGIDDAADEAAAVVDAAADLVAKAEAAEDAAQAELDKANEDGLITPEEKAAIVAANDEVIAAKEKAVAAVDSLPAGEDKTALANRADAVEPVVVPAVNDANANGIDDAADEAAAVVDAAADLVAKAEAAEDAAQAELDKANEDGLITPEEKAAIVAANDEVIAAKEKAVAAVDSLPASEDKTALANRADAVEPVVVPAVNDANANGIDDAADEAAAVVDAAADLVAKAEAAEDAAQAELDKANEDGLITPEEKAAIVAANDEVIAAKEKAVAAVDSLPAGEDKTALANRADAVEPVVVPAVNDANANGIDDAADEAAAVVDAAADLVAKAEAAEDAAQAELDKANEDGLITPKEEAAIVAANDKVIAAKEKAVAAVDSLPASEDKTALANRADAVEPVVVPAVNDANANGIDDAADEAAAVVDAAADLVAKAEAAEDAAQAELDKANEDGLITPKEEAAIVAANDKVIAAKEKAVAAVDSLPASEDKTALANRADAVEPVVVPAVNDANANGIDDAADEAAAVVDAAADLVAKAEAAEDAAQAELDKANEDGLITPKEEAAIVAANDKVIAAKEKAVAAVDSLPASEDKTALANRADAVEPVVVPAVNDANANGIDDAADEAAAVVDAAADLVAKAEAAEDAAQAELDKANEDGLITPKEEAAIVAANDKVIAAKEKAVAAVDSLPASEDKTALANRADAVEPVVVPAVNDANANGIDDAADEAAAVVDAAADLVAKAEAAEDAAQAELDKANEDGLITPKEEAAIVAANDKVIAAKEKAVAAVDSLPASEDKTALANRADAVEPVVVPAVNDANANGIDDAADEAAAVVDAAADLVAKAEAAEDAAQAELDKANEDGLITPKEEAAIVAANDKVIAAKEKAVAAVDSLPASEDKTALANRADAVEPVVVPAVNDANANGIDDAADEAAAVVDAAADLVAKAEAAEDAAQAELDKANEDGLITPKEEAAIVAANDKVIAAKEKAVAAVDSLPASEDKTALANRADAVEPVVVPAVNDANANGIDDAQEQNAEDLVAAAEQAEADAQTIADSVDSNNDGLVTQAEVDAIAQDLADANEAVVDAEAAAQQAVDALPDSPEKTAFNDRLAEVDEVATPAVTDSDNNGIDDAQEQNAEDLVAAAEQAEADAQTIADSVDSNNDGLVTQAEVDAIAQDLADANEAVVDAEAAAQQAVDALPDSPEKTAFNDRLAEVDEVATPAVTDSDNNGIDDAQEQNAEDLVAAAEQAEADAQAIADSVDSNNDGLVTQAEVDAIAQDLADANEAVVDAEAAAQQAVDALPDSPEKTAFNDRLAEVDEVATPAVTDSDNNGIDDAQEQNAEDLVAAAEQAEADAQTIADSVDSNNDGLVTQAEVDAIAQDLADANEAVVDAEAAAQQAVDALPDSPEKTAFNDRLAEVDEVATPAVTDSDNNGIDDAQEQNAEDLVAAAEQAEADAQTIADSVDSNNDGLVTQAEVDAIAQDLADANEAVVDAEAAAQQAVDALPDSPEKTAFNDRLAEVDEVATPAVTDSDNNGIDDAQEQNAEDLVAAAEQAEADAQTIADSVDSNNDGLVTQAEVDAIAQDLADANEAVVDAEAAAQQAVDALPDSPEKTAFNDRLAEVDEVATPAVSSDGKVPEPTISLETDTLGESGSDLVSSNGTLALVADTQNDPTATITSVDYVKDDESTGSITANAEGEYVLGEGKYVSITVTSTDEDGTATAMLENVQIDQVAPDFDGDSTVDILDSIAAGISFKVEDIDTIGYYEGAQTGQVIGQIVAKEARDSDTGVYRYEWADSNDATQQSWYNLNPDGTVSLTAAGVASTMNDYETGIKSVQLNVKAIDVAGNESIETITFVLGNTIGIGAIRDTMNTTDQALDQSGFGVSDVNAPNALQPSDFADKIYVGKNEDGTPNINGNGNMYNGAGGDGYREDPIILSGGGADFISFNEAFISSKIFSGTGDDTILINDINGLDANADNAPFFFTEEGDDLVVTSGDIYASNIMTGSGSDRVIIEGDLRGESTVNLGSNVAVTSPTSQNGNVLAGYQYYLDNNLGADTIGDTADDINTITITGDMSAQARIIGGLGQDNGKHPTIPSFFLLKNAR